MFFIIISTIFFIVKMFSGAANQKQQKMSNYFKALGAARHKHYKKPKKPDTGPFGSVSSFEVSKNQTRGGYLPALRSFSYFSIIFLTI